MREYIKNKDLDLKFLREAFFVVGSKKISDFVKCFPTKKQHLPSLSMNSEVQKVFLQYFRRIGREIQDEG